MTDAPYDLRLELSRRHPAHGQDRRIGELHLTTTDPEVALAVRNELRATLGMAYQVEVYTVEQTRARLLCVETYPAPKPKPAPVEDGRYINLSTAIGALLKAGDALSNHILAETVPNRQECRDITRAMAVFDLPRDPIGTAAQVGMTALSLYDLGTTYGVVKAACAGLALTDKRLDEVRADLLKRNHEIHEPNKRLAEAHALQDLYAIDGGYTLSAPWLVAFEGDSNDTTDLIAPPNEAPYKVVLDGAQSFDDVIRWQDDHLDPVYSVSPAPGETRLDGYRSIMLYGRSYALTPKP